MSPYCATHGSAFPTNRAPFCQPCFVWFVQEYDKCFNLVRECSPHARIQYDCTSIESFRESALLIFFRLSTFTIVLYSGTLLTSVHRPDHITDVTTPHDATQTDIETKVEGL